MNQLSKRTGRAAASFVACAVMSFGAAADPSFTVTEIGHDIRATALNDLGQVTGYMDQFQPPYQTKTFLYTPGVGLQFIVSPQFTGYGWDINNAGQIAGQGGASPSSPQNAYRYTPGAGLSNVAPASSTDFSAAYAMNDHGAAAGTFRVPGTSDNHAFLYTETGAKDIDLQTGRNSYATAVNERGQVVGFTVVSGQADQGFLYTEATGMQALTGGAAYSILRDINDSGLAVGDFGATTNTLAGTIDAATGTLDYLPFSSDWFGQSQTGGLNNAGEVTGTAAYGSSPGEGNRAFYFDPKSKRVFDLNTLIDPSLGLRLVEGMDVNDRGQILVNGLFAEGGGYGSFLLTPVPEPGDVGLFVAGLAGLWMWRWAGKRRRAMLAARHSSA